MREPTKEVSDFQRKKWNQGCDREHDLDKHRLRKIRRRWNQFLHEKTKEYNFG